MRFKNAIKRIATIAIFVFLGLIITALPVLAIVNPDNIEFGSGTAQYRAFYDVREAGDMLFVAEGFVDYAVEPTDFTASQAFLFQILDVTGLIVELSTPINQYGDRPISIYQTAAQVTAKGFNPGDALGFRITGNPLVFGDPTGNTVTAFLAASDWIDQLLGVDGGVASANPLRNFLIGMAQIIQDEDSPTDDYIEAVRGVKYLTADGADIFLEGIPGLSTFCGILFQTSLEPMLSEAPDAKGAYPSTLTPVEKWGTITANGLTNLGVYLGINQALAGSVVLFILVMMMALFVYTKTKSGVAVLLMVATTPFVGAYLGLMPMALAFIFVILIVLLMGYFFFSRGAL